MAYYHNRFPITDPPIILLKHQVGNKLGGQDIFHGISAGGYYSQTITIAPFLTGPSNYPQGRLQTAMPVFWLLCP